MGLNLLIFSISHYSRVVRINYMSIKSKWRPSSQQYLDLLSSKNKRVGDEFDEVQYYQSILAEEEKKKATRPGIRSSGLERACAVARRPGKILRDRHHHRQWNHVGVFSAPPAVAAIQPRWSSSTSQTFRIKQFEFKVIIMLTDSNGEVMHLSSHEVRKSIGFYLFLFSLNKVSVFLLHRGMFTYDATQWGEGRGLAFCVEFCDVGVSGKLPEVNCR